MKKILFIALFFFSFSALSQKNTLTVYSEPSDVKHRLYVGTVFPFRMDAGYEFQYKRLQIGGFVGFTPQKFQSLVFEILERIKPEYVGEINYLRLKATPKVQFGGELKLDIGKGWSLGGTVQTFNATLTDTPKNIVEGVLPEKVNFINAVLNDPNIPNVKDVKSAYDTKIVDAYMNSIIAGPVLEKTLWLNIEETIFIRAKASYWFLVTKDNDLLTKDFTSTEQVGLDAFKPLFLDKLEKISSKLQAPSFGIELGFAF